VKCASSTPESAFHGLKLCAGEFPCSAFALDFADVKITQRSRSI
jgi:hypothetical protein